MWRHKVSRTPPDVTARFLRPLAALALLAATLPGVAVAATGGEKEVPRHNSFGGSCPKCELSGRRLAGAQFIAADFSGAALVGSDLREARFMASNFSGADMSRADLTDSELMGAVFRGANLSHARLRSTSAKAVVFAGANLSGADLSDSEMVAANFQDAVMPRVIMRSAE